MQPCRAYGREMDRDWGPVLELRLAELGNDLEATLPWQHRRLAGVAHEAQAMYAWAIRTGAAEDLVGRLCDFAHDAVRQAHQSDLVTRSPLGWAHGHADTSGARATNGGST